MENYQIIKNDTFIKYLDENGDVIAEIIFPLTSKNENTITKTFVSESLRGMGIAKKLVLEAIEIIKNQNHTCKSICSYATKVIKESEN